MRKGGLDMGQHRLCNRMVILACTAVMAGCSADVSRLDSNPSFSLNDPPGSSSLIRPSASLNRSAVGAANVDTSKNTPTRAPDRGVEMAALSPPAASPAPYAPPPADPSPGRYAPSAAAANALSATARRANAAPAPAPVATTEKGDAVNVKPGDTLTAIARQHNVLVSELMRVNNLNSSALKPGQTLYLPKTVRKPILRPDAVAASAPAIGSARVRQAPLAAEVAANYTNNHTVQKGDSLYALAIKMKVPMAELQQVNGITDVRKVKPGTVLKVPGAAVAAAPSGMASAPVVAGSGTSTSVPSESGAAVVAKVPAAVVQADAATVNGGVNVGAGPMVAPARPTLINGEKQIAALDPKPGTMPTPIVSGGVNANDASPTASPASLAGDTRLRWPVRGRIVAGFGARPDGTHNDGLNLQVPHGTEVHAAEAGAVAYAGSELKGYGNLVLIRHDNGWITAYAHNSEILVKRGDRVKRGQVVAKSGKTGSVDQPQVHFELRQGSKPVDPTPHMEKM